MTDQQMLFAVLLLVLCAYACLDLWHMFRSGRRR